MDVSRRWRRLLLVLPTELWALYICRWECAAAKARHYHGMQIERVLGANLDMSISRLNRS